MEKRSDSSIEKTHRIFSRIDFPRRLPLGYKWKTIIEGVSAVTIIERLTPTLTPIVQYGLNRNDTADHTSINHNMGSLSPNMLVQGSRSDLPAIERTICVTDK